MRGACVALIVAMKQHIHHEEAALYSCQAIRALCSCGDQTNQRLLRRAGVCELVAQVLKASVPLSATASQLYIPESIEVTVGRSSNDSSGGIFNQMMYRARTMSFTSKPSVPILGRPTSFSITSSSAGTQPPGTGPQSGCGADWKDKLRVSLAAVRAICCLSSGSEPDRDGDYSGSNGRAKVIFGEEGIIEPLVEIGASCTLLGETRDRNPSMPIAVAQWITLALCHLIDPSDDLHSENDGDIDESDFLKPRKVTSLNLNRLCFCNRSGDFLVNSVLSYTAGNSGVTNGDIDALVYNSLSIMVSMCDDKVGNHKILSSEGMCKMVLQLVTRYSSAITNTTSKWLLLLSLSLASSSAQNSILAEKLIQGGLCRQLASTLVAHLLPTATKAIQQQSSTENITRSRRRSMFQYPGTTTDRGVDVIDEIDLEKDDNRMSSSSSSRPTGLSSEKNSSNSLTSKESQVMRSEFEDASFGLMSDRNDTRNDVFGDTGNGALRVTTAIRSIIEVSMLNEGSTIEDRDLDAGSSDLLAIVLAREACTALTRLLSATTAAGALQSEKSPVERNSLGVRKKSFSNPVRIYRDSVAGNIAGIGLGSTGNLVDALSVVLLVADSSLMFFGDTSSTASIPHSTGQPSSGSGSGSGSGSVSRSIGGADVSEREREDVSPSPILLPAVKELRQVAQTVVQGIQMQQQYQRRIL